MTHPLDRKSLLTPDNPQYIECVKHYCHDAVLRDVSENGDMTTDSLFKSVPRAKAVILAKQQGVIAGLAEASVLYQYFGAGTRQLMKDGSAVETGTVVMEIEGPLDVLLKVERRALELLRRMSGIATHTAKLVDTLEKEGCTAKVAATRKAPWELLDKKAVALGGALTHRLNLADAILIKDNHLEQLSLNSEQNPIQCALTAAWACRDKAAFIEIEVTTAEQAMHAARVFHALKEEKGEAGKGTQKETHCVVMLDNMSPGQMREIIEKLKEAGLRKGVWLEASGKITPENAVDYGKSGVDIISLGWLTHSVGILDLSQEIVRGEGK